jgi:NADPH:quinone reductase-like Zn-dependent oxidoreductase
VPSNYHFQVFATVGSDKKREFLTSTFGIPPEHIFSSRSTTFASQIMDITDGNGVDVILNSLTGNLLDESWRCISDGGTMIEIGKKDVLARNSLSMEPFNRNATYRGVDMSHLQISDSLIASCVFSIPMLQRRMY